MPSGGLFSRFKSADRPASTLSPPRTSSSSSRNRSPASSRPASPPAAFPAPSATPRVVLSSDENPEGEILPSPQSLHRVDSESPNSNSPKLESFPNDGSRKRPPAMSLTAPSPSEMTAVLDVTTPTPNTASASHLQQLRMTSNTSTPTPTPMNRAYESPYGNTNDASRAENEQTLPPRSRSSSLASLLHGKASKSSLRSAAAGGGPHSRRGSVASSDASSVDHTLSHVAEVEDDYRGGHARTTSGSLVPSTTQSSLESRLPESRSNTMSVSGSNFLSPSGKDSDAVSMISTRSRSGTGASGSKKKRWGGGGKSGPAGGIAGALAASGMSLAYPGSPPSPPLAIQTPDRSNSIKHRHTRSNSTTRTSIDSVLLPRRDESLHVRSSEELGVYPEDGEDDIYESPDALSFDEEDIPVTGFAVASSRRNADFHEMFPDVTEGDYLIEDYGCALQRDILVQGRLYISENFLCFHANIFGWVTNLTIPFAEVTAIEKKMTAFVIPNAIQISTPKAKYTFASFITRDTSFDVMYNVWRLCTPQGTDSNPISMTGAGEDGSEGSSSDGRAVAKTANGGSAAAAHPPTQCKCAKGEHYAEVMMECIFPGTPEQIHNLIWTSAFIREFMSDNQKLMDIQVSDWAPVQPGSQLLTRNMSYIKPLNNSLGPKSTKCEITDETVHVDFNDYVSTVTTTRTPGVPSGNVFSTKTRTCVMWAGPASTKVMVTSAVEWTGRSFIKSMIEKGAMDGQRSYNHDLEVAMRKYISDHKSEFFPEGMEADDEGGDLSLGAEVLSPSRDTAPPLTPAELIKAKQRETEQRGLQWALDTFMGAWNVASQSAKGAIEILGDMVEVTPRTTILGLIIVGLIVSNIWTLVSLKDAKQRDALTKRRQMKMDEVAPRAYTGEMDPSAEALRVLLEGVISSSSRAQAPPLVVPQVSIETGSFEDEVRGLHEAIAGLEERVSKLKARLPVVPPSSRDGADSVV